MMTGNGQLTKVHSELNDFLRNPYFKDAVDFLTLDIPGVADGLQIQAVPDMDFTSDPYLPGNVMSLLQSGQFDKSIEVIFGNNADEGIFVTGPQTNGFREWDEYRETFEIEGTAMLFGIANKSDITNEDVEKMSELISYYVGSIDNINKEHQQGIIDMFTDASFQYCTHETINYLVQYGVTVYQYILSYEGKYSFSTLDGVPVGTGVTHGDDLFYLWDMPYLTDLGYNIGKI